MTMQNPVHKEHRMAGQGAILLCAVLWSTSGLFIKLVNWHPALIAGSRSFLAAVFLLILRRFSKNPAGNSPGLVRLAASGLCYAITMILFVIANKMTASANVILLQYTAPVWAALLGWFFLREKPHWEHWTALALVSLGMFLVFSSALAAGSVTGDIIALISGLTFGANSVLMRMQKDGSPADIMISAHIITTLFSIPFFFLYPPVISAGNITSILFMGIFQIGAASALFAYGIKRIPAVQAMLTATVEPVLNPVWVLLVTGEKPALPVIAGGCVIMGAVFFSSIMEKKR
ncbi:MAG: DMT family transporter [Treponema sp.]|nr:DMT family transporter [Treponema sp.]